MSSRFANRNKRCPNCKIHPNLCFCSLLVKEQNRTPIRIVMHKAERTLTTNTAYFCEKMLADCQIHIRGLQEKPLDIEGSFNQEDYTPLYLFPDEDSKDLTMEFLNELEKPPLLIVPDGSWAQAKKFKRRESSLKNLISVKLPTINESIYRLRTSPAPGAVCTYEAIAMALGICDGRAIENNMLEVFKVITDRMYYSRKGIVNLDQLSEILKKEGVN